MPSFRYVKMEDEHRGQLYRRGKGSLIFYLFCLRSQPCDSLRQLLLVYVFTGAIFLLAQRRQNTDSISTTISILVLICVFMHEASSPISPPVIKLRSHKKQSRFYFFNLYAPLCLFRHFNDASFNHKCSTFFTASQNTKMARCICSVTISP